MMDWCTGDTFGNIGFLSGDIVEDKDDSVNDKLFKIFFDTCLDRSRKRFIFYALEWTKGGYEINGECIILF